MEKRIEKVLIAFRLFLCFRQGGGEEQKRENRSTGLNRLSAFSLFQTS